MSLEEEILINQFGQGVRSSVDVIDQFTQLDNAQQRHRFVFLYCELGESTWSESDVRQALADCSLENPEVMYNYLNFGRLTASTKRSILIPHTSNPPNGRLDRAYEVLLALFKIGYQRRFALENSNSNAWQYRNLSDPEVVKSIMDQHRSLVEQVYANSGYRSEFACLAKSWRDDKLSRQQQASEPTDAPQTHFDFMTYDEMVTNLLAQFDNKNARGLSMLRHSLAQALVKQYGLSPSQANRLVFDVIERHLLDTYNMTLF